MTAVGVSRQEPRAPVERLAPASVSGPLSEIMSAMHVDTGGQVAYVGSIPARDPSYGRPNPPLPPPLSRALRRLDISHLFSHQAEALRLARDGRDVVVVTSTSSGKTLCYNLPVLERILSDRKAHALYIYPINALINDQFNVLARLNLELGPERRRHRSLQRLRDQRSAQGHPRAPAQYLADKPGNGASELLAVAPSLDTVVAQPRLCGPGRGAHLSRRVRRPHGWPDTPPACASPITMARIRSSSAARRRLPTRKTWLRASLPGPAQW